MHKKIDINDSWYSLLETEFQSIYFSELVRFVENERAAGKTIYPPENLTFNAFNQSKVDQVKVVIIGQDPYHGSSQAMGLSFSVPKTIKIPPSLKRIFKEIVADVGGEIPSHGDLTAWSKQGVLLLNAILTVEHKMAGSHRKKGWEQFTDAVIQRLSETRAGIVFMLWGNFAKSKADLIDSNNHLILRSAHPSPLAGNAFFGNHHFSQANAYLISQNKAPIDWQIRD